MQKTFSSSEYVKSIGQLLVMEFEFARKLATTPGLVGHAMEYPVRGRLEQILPKGIAVGSGCIIDTNGKTSRQMDIVLYERDICPVFSVNNSPETTYYPCEGVIAVGEVKSFFDKPKMKDAFEKIESVKRLVRNFDEPKLPAHPLQGRKVFDYRKYGQTAGGGVINMEYIPSNDEFSEIFGFVLGGKLQMRPETMLDYYVDLVDGLDDALCPNMAVFLSGETFFSNKLWRTMDNREEAEKKQSIRTSNSVLCKDIAYPFGELIAWLYNTYQLGRTANTAAFTKYFMGSSGKSKIVKVKTIKDRTELGTRPIVKGLL